MSCRLIISPITGEEVQSKTWDDIRKLVNTDEEADVYYNQLTSPEFINWFGDWVNTPKQASRIVNDIGEPLLMHHASDSKHDTFDVKKIDKDNKGRAKGFHFSSSTFDLKRFGKNRYAVFLNVRSPRRQDNISQMYTDVKTKDMDGLISRFNIKDTGSAADVVVYEPNQIKSVFNNGEFSVEQDNIYQQTPGTEGSEASTKTLALVNKWLERVGVTKQTLPQYDLGGRKIDANGQANLLNDVIRIAEGKEGVALTEEAMHFAVAIIKQTNSQLFKQMMNKIGTFNYYKKIFNEYSKRYVLKDGSPDILKIKEEAIGKILAEYLIRDVEGATEKPELLAQTLSWWDQIKNFFLALIGKAEFNPFQEAVKEIDRIEDTSSLEAPYKDLADRIMAYAPKGIYGMAANNAYKQGRYRGIVTMFSEQLEDPETYQTIIDGFFEGNEEFAQEILKAGEVFLQTAEAPKETIFDKINKKIQDFQLIKHPDSPSLDGEDNGSYYTVNINGKEVKTDRTTSWADRENIKRNGGKDYFANPTPDQEKKWAQKAMSGTNGHKALEAIIENNLNPDGTLKPKDQWRAPENSLIAHDIYVDMVRFLLGYKVPVTGEIKQGFLDQFPAGAKFGMEKMLYNDKPFAKVKNKKTGKIEELYGRASTTDLLVVMPDESIKIYDWKFMGFLLEKPDQTFLKRNQHALQLGDYKTTLRNEYGAKKIDAYTIPIHAQYVETTSDAKLVSVTFGEVNFKNERRTSLLPVVPVGQSSGNKKIDQLIASLEAHYKKVYSRKEDPSTKYQKIEQLQQLSSAIRNLQVALNFDPLAADLDNFIISSKKVLDKYVELDFTGVDEETLTKQLDELLEVYHSAETYSGIDEVFRSEYGEDLTEEQKRILDKLSVGATASGILKEKALAVLKKYVTFLAQKEGVDNILSPTKEVKGMLNTMLERGSILSPMVNLAVKRLLDKRSRDKQIVAKEIGKFGELYTALVKLANGKDLFKLIGDGNQLIRKVKKEFWTSFNDAIASQNKQFIKDNINQESFNKELEETINKRLEIIRDSNYTTDIEENNKKRAYYAEELLETFNIYSDNFKGWNDRQFTNLVKKHLIPLQDTTQDSIHWTEEYKNIRKKGNEAALDMHSYLYEMNRKAFSLGYLANGNSMAFFPLVTGTMFERLAQANSATGTLQDIFSDLYKVDASQEQAYGKTNPETGEIEKSIPKLFTKTNKSEEALSKDLLKVVPLYIRVLQEYSTSKDLEMEMLTYEMVERAKGHLEEEGGLVIFDAEGPKEFKGNENNANILKDLTEWNIYGIRESSNTFFDKVASSVTKGTEEEKKAKAVSAKKLLTQGNILTQSLAVGLKAMVAIPNFVGNNMQAIVNAGLYYNWPEFQKNQGKIVMGALLGKDGNIEKGLMDLVIPLNDDIVKSAQRKIAIKQSTAKWLGTWTFQEFMMSTNQYPDMLIQLANAKSFNDNAMVVNGEIVNIKQHLLSLPEYKNRYKDPSSIKQKERELADKIKELKETSSLSKIAKFNKEGFLEIPGVSEEAIAKYRTSVVEYGRKITGQMSTENSAKYRQDILVKSFMMFKNWIPKQVALRTLDIKKNVSLNQWEYGRTRLFMKTISHLGARNILQIRDIIGATPRGIEIMKAMVDKKREDYYKKTGLELTISDEEFYDMVRKELSSQMKELAILVSLIGLVVAAKAAAPPDDDDLLAKNRYKFWAKAINKISDEMWFYYSPTSAESITRGSLFPSLSLISKVEKTIKTAKKDLFGYIEDDEEAMDKAHTLKYFFNIVPVAAQFQNELFPIIDPEGAKDWGIITSEAARAMR